METSEAAMEPATMDFEYSPKVKDLQARLTRFMEERIVPRDLAFHQQAEAGQFPPDF